MKDNAFDGQVIVGHISVPLRILKLGGNRVSPNDVVHSGPHAMEEEKIREFIACAESSVVYSAT